MRLTGFAALRFHSFGLLGVLVAGWPAAAQVCGGIGGIPCSEPGTFCQLPDGSCCCDFFGECQPIPTVCPEVCDPVCGCDGVTYENRCEASRSRMSVSRAAPCDEKIPPVQIEGFDSLDKLFWDPALPGTGTETGFNVYLRRGESLPPAYSGVCLYADVPEYEVLLKGRPDPGAVWMFQVTELRAEGEGSMGRGSDCAPRTPAAPCTCTLPAETGPCDAEIPRWYYDHASGECELFSWGGCEGNLNRFETQSDCVAACLDPCVQPAISGDCQAAVPRWYYNVLTGHCDQFVWGGCAAQANNFLTEQDCLAQCGDICLLLPDVGDCDGLCPRWFWNDDTGVCEEFIWGCCDGNANNFPTEEACQSECSP